MGESGAIERKPVLYGRTHKIKTGCGNAYVVVNRNVDTAKIMETFVILGKSGGCAAAQLEANGRLISRMLRRGFDASFIAKDLCGIRCHAPSMVEGEMITSCADAIGRVLQQEIEWEKTEEFAAWWKAQTGKYPPGWIKVVIALKVPGEGGGENAREDQTVGGGAVPSEEVRPGCEGSGEVEELPDPRCAVEEPPPEAKPRRRRP